MLTFLCFAFLIGLLVLCVRSPGTACAIGAAVLVLFGSRGRDPLD